MTAIQLVRREDVQVFHATWSDLLAILPYRDDGTKVDALIVDAPYSDRTHAGHDGAAAAEEGATWVRSNGRVERKIQRRDINYAAWTPADVHAFVDVPALVRGMTVRLTGDGPSSWAIHCAVSRPRRLDMARWGTLRGGYEGPAEAQEVTGGKPLWLMEALVRDYSRAGDLVCDPCCGGGRTLHAALRSGRRAVGGDAKREHADISARVVSRMVQRSLFDRVEAAPPAEQLGLLGETGS